MSQPERRGRFVDRLMHALSPLLVGASFKSRLGPADRRGASAPVAEVVSGGVGAQSELDIGKLACDFEELCAQVAESAENDFPELSHAGDYWNGFRFACEEVACRIRLRLDQRAEPNPTDNGEA